MTDFTLLSSAQIIQYVDRNFHFFSSERDDRFPENMIDRVSGSLWATIKRKEGFAIVFLGINSLLGNDGENADLMFLHVLPEFERRGIGTEIAKEAISCVPLGRAMDVTCEGADRVVFFEKCGFTLCEHDEETDLYYMRRDP